MPLCTAKPETMSRFHGRYFHLNVPINLYCSLTTSSWFRGDIIQWFCIFNNLLSYKSTLVIYRPQQTIFWHITFLIKLKHVFRNPIFVIWINSFPHYTAIFKYQSLLSHSLYRLWGWLVNAFFHVESAVGVISPSGTMTSVIWDWHATQRITWKKNIIHCHKSKSENSRNLVKSMLMAHICIHVRFPCWV
jgi:hypothetical protein